MTENAIAIPVKMKMNCGDAAVEKQSQFPTSMTKTAIVPTVQTNDGWSPPLSR